MGENLLGGLDYMPVARQTNRYSCGPACLKTIANQLGFYAKLPTSEITRLAQVTPVSGTTEVEMARGLDALGLAYEHSNGSRRLSHLCDAVDDGRAVLLRTLLPGGHKHWVVLHGYDNRGQFAVSCPARGALLWSGDFVEEVWSARNYDNFAVPLDRRLHPVALARGADTEWKASKPIHLMTLPEFLGKAFVIKDSQLRSYHLDLITTAAATLEGLAERGAGTELSYPHLPEFSFRVVPRTRSFYDMLVVERQTGNLAGGIARGVRWVHPEFRNKGLGAELVLVSFSVPHVNFLRPSSYSEAGYGSRISAYKLAIQRAEEAGLAIPARVWRSFASVTHQERKTEGLPATDGLQLRLF